ncbi:MAG TPA: hypothetical protein QF753_17405 [Victivallales bacterium]|nr:hypothetical protein [Victivallales bacterium]
MLLFKSSLISTLLILLSFCINTGCKNSSVQNINNPADIKHFNSAQPNEIFAYLGPIVMNNTKYWPGDEIKLSVPFMVTGLSNSKQVNLNISVCIKDINKQSKKISVKQQNNEVFFNFILPERISEGYKTVTVELRSNKSLDSFTTKIFVYKPKIHISRVIAKPEIINPGELITLYGYY